MRIYTPEGDYANSLSLNQKKSQQCTTVRIYTPEGDYANSLSLNQKKSQQCTTVRIYTPEGDYANSLSLNQKKSQQCQQCASIHLKVTCEFAVAQSKEITTANVRIIHLKVTCDSLSLNQKKSQQCALTQTQKVCPLPSQNIHMFCSPRGLFFFRIDHCFFA
ncbi:hypothetical protein ACT7DZ_17530 [Bacillus cereus]